MRCVVVVCWAKVRQKRAKRLVLCVNIDGKKEEEGVTAAPRPTTLLHPAMGNKQL